MIAPLDPCNKLGVSFLLRFLALLSSIKSSEVGDEHKLKQMR